MQLSWLLLASCPSVVVFGLELFRIPKLSIRLRDRPGPCPARPPLGRPVWAPRSASTTVSRTSRLSMRPRRRMKLAALRRCLAQNAIARGCAHPRRRRGRSVRGRRHALILSMAAQHAAHGKQTATEDARVTPSGEYQFSVRMVPWSCIAQVSANWCCGVCRSSLPIWRPEFQFSSAPCCRTGSARHMMML